MILLSFLLLLAGLVLLSLLPAHAARAGTIVVYGDSISAAHGMEQQAGWVSLLSRQLTEAAPDYRVINASVSGETTGGGVTRLQKTLTRHQPDIIIIELGGNDGLRGYPVANIRQNLDLMIRQSQEAGSKVLLIGMVLPPNYGRRYIKAFEAIFPALAKKYALPFVPRLLDGVTTQAQLLQEDGIHPTAAAQPAMLEDVWPSLAPLL